MAMGKKTAEDNIIKTIFRKGIIILIWLSVWQLASILTGLDFILAGPVEVLFVMAQFLRTAEFYLIAANTTAHILLGLFLGTLLGTVFGLLAFRVRLVRELLEIPVYACKAMPVVAFIILVLMWAGSAYADTVISLIVVFPVIYLGLINSLLDTDKGLLEMARIFQIKGRKKWYYIYEPQIMKGIIYGLSIAVGLAFKAGVSAQVIGLCGRTIGEQMYMAKLYLLSANLLAWSIWLVVISFIVEKVIVRILTYVKECWEAR